MKQHKLRLIVDEDVFRALRGKIRAHLRIHGKYKTLPIKFIAKILDAIDSGQDSAHIRKIKEKLHR